MTQESTSGSKNHHFAKRYGFTGSMNRQDRPLLCANVKLSVGNPAGKGYPIWISFPGLKESIDAEVWLERGRRVSVGERFATLNSDRQYYRSIRLDDSEVEFDLCIRPVHSENWLWRKRLPVLHPSIHSRFAVTSATDWQYKYVPKWNGLRGIGRPHLAARAWYSDPIPVLYSHNLDDSRDETEFAEAGSLGGCLIEMIHPIPGVHLRHALIKSSLIIGSNPELCQIAFPKAARNGVKDRHIRIMYIDGGLWVEPYDRTCTLQIDGNPLYPNQLAPLTNQTTLRLGKSFILSCTSIYQYHLP